MAVMRLPMLMTAPIENIFAVNEIITKKGLQMYSMRILLDVQDRNADERGLTMTTKQQYRIEFHKSAEVRVDPFELAWLLSKHGMDVVAKNEVPMLFVQCSEFDLTTFMIDVNRLYGPLIFKQVDVSVPGEGYVDANLV